MAIEILSDGAVVRTITHVLTASLCDKLDGTLTFDFTALQKGEQPILPGMTAKYDGQYYSIVRGETWLFRRTGNQRGFLRAHFLHLK